MNQTPDIVWPEGYAAALKAVERAKQRLDTAKLKLEAQQKQAGIICANCRATYPIATQEYIQTHWYTEPHGCTGGDYWNSGEAQWRCPSCGFKNRFEDKADRYQTMKNEFHRPELVALKSHFGSVRDCYCDYRRKCETCRKREAA